MTDTEVVEQVVECEECGEEAVWLLAFLLPNARRNPASSGYGKDDISWCSDAKMFVCDKCRHRESALARERGMEWCASYGKPRFPHMFR